MIGNDIVDLKIAAKESNWKRSRYLNKVFSIAEQGLILNSENQSQMLWLLWSMKEAAYKIYIQQSGIRIFNPIKLTCELVSKGEGIVHYNQNHYVTKSEINDTTISTVAYSEVPKKTLYQGFTFQNMAYNTQSNIARQQLLKTFSNLKNLPVEKLEIKTDENSVPRLFYNGNKQRDSFSIAHHGFYGAFAILEYTKY
jgi:phosphopantetheinyl transferase (holo-ACP synthase)